MLLLHCNILYHSSPLCEAAQKTTGKPSLRYAMAEKKRGKGWKEGFGYCNDKHNQCSQDLGGKSVQSIIYYYYYYHHHQPSSSSSSSSC